MVRDIIHGGDPEDEANRPRATRTIRGEISKDWDEIYKNTKGAASLVMEDEQHGVTHD